LWAQTASTKLNSSKENPNFCKKKIIEIKEYFSLGKYPSLQKFPWNGTHILPMKHFFVN